MLRAQIGKELVVCSADEIGVLASLAKVLSERGINIQAMGAWVDDGMGTMRLVTDDHLRASEALANRFEVSEAMVIMIEVEHKPGILRTLSDTLAGERINVTHLYASAAAGQGNCLVVLNTSDNERALVLLND